MVNTFITVYPLDVSDLDSKRLGKQRVEAYQILNLLINAHIIASKYGYPEVKNIEDFKNTYKKYRKETKIDGITGGFYAHPMVLMWFGYEGGLRYYINLCINEWIRRGFKNTMKTYDLSGIPDLPWWVKSEALHNSHKSALLRKELVREEPEWYWKKPSFAKMITTEWFNYGYLWTTHLSEEQTLTLKKESMEASEVCDPIKNDWF